MQDIPLIPNVYLHKLLKVMEEENLPVQHLLHECGIDIERINRSYEFVSYEQMYAVTSHYLHLTNDPNPGVRYGLQLELLTHGLLGYIYTFKGPPYQLIKNIVTYMNIRLPLLNLTCHHNDDFFSVRFHCFDMPETIKRFVLQVFMTNFYNLGTLLIPNISIYTKDKLFKPNRKLQDTFKTSIEDGHEHNELRYYMHSHARPMPQKTIEYHDENTANLPNFVLKLRQFLLRHCDNLPSEKQMAAHLGMSERTLRRRLSEAGYSYRNIRLEICMNMASRYLQSTDISIERIANRCGYSDQAAFTRAFQKWTGHTPSTERRTTPE